MNSALIIDDDKVVQAYLKRILELKFSFTVYQALNGVEGLNFLKEIKPGLIFLDHSMPLMDGLEFLKIFRKDESNKNTPVFVISASKEIQIVKDMINLGVDDYILKPINPEATYSRILKVLNDKKM